MRKAHFIDLVASPKRERRWMIENGIAKGNKMNVTDAFKIQIYTLSPVRNVLF